MHLRHSHSFLLPHASDGFVAFAHRGGSKLLPENSLAAFRAATDIGYRYLETDVQLTSDGRLVAFHDSNLLRTCGVDRDISSLTADDVSSLRIDGQEPIPFLEELFEELPRAMFNVDAKSDDCVAPLIDFLRRTSSFDRVCIGSFSHRRLQRIREALGSKVCTSASPREVASWMIGVPLRGPSCVQIPLRQAPLRVVTEKRVERSHRAGIPVHVWTIDDPAVMQGLIDLGVDGIMTDEAHTLKHVAETNSIWT